MLRMHMTRAEKDLVAVHKKALSIYPAWPCNCCGQIYPKGAGNPMIDIFRPPRGIRMTTKEVAATFVICEGCQKLPDPEISKGVIAGFLQRKLAVVVA
jgi:hypothetical protein